jgi:hypothetical protein
VVPDPFHDRIQNGPEHPVDGLFARGLGGHGSPPPRGGWERVAAQLDAEAAHLASAAGPAAPAPEPWYAGFFQAGRAGLAAALCAGLLVVSLPTQQNFGVLTRIAPFEAAQQDVSPRHQGPQQAEWAGQTPEAEAVASLGVQRTPSVTAPLTRSIPKALHTHPAAWVPAAGLSTPEQRIAQAPHLVIASFEPSFMPYSAAEPVFAQTQATAYAPAEAGSTGPATAKALPAQQPESISPASQGARHPTRPQTDPALARLPEPEQPQRQRDASVRQNKGWDFSRIYGGMHLNVQYTSLLNQGSGQPDDNLDAMLSIGQAYGATLGYALSPRVSMETGLVLDSRQGARYQSTLLTRKNEELPVTKSILLHYTQIPLTVRVRSNAQASPERVSWHYVGGLQYGMLRNSRLRLDDRNVSPDRDLQEHELAVLLGMDCDIPLANRMFLSLGVRSSLGLNPAGINSVEGINRDKHNAVVGFRAAFNGFLVAN